MPFQSVIADTGISVSSRCARGWFDLDARDRDLVKELTGGTSNKGVNPLMRLSRWGAACRPVSSRARRKDVLLLDVTPC